MSYSNVGKVWDPQGFKDFLVGEDTSWASSVTIHHTAFPHLEMRPKGFTIQHMRNLQSYYQNDLGWSAGPHLFTDDDEILGLSPLTSPGTHAKSFNRDSIGIEMLGDYDHVDDPHSGRGADVLHTSILATAALLEHMELGATSDTIKFHRDDPKTSKTCPGKKIDKDWFVGKVAAAMEDTDAEPPAPEVDPATILAACDAIEWQTKKIRECLG